MKVSKMSFATTASLALALLLSVAAQAQHLISSKAGFINRADGKVFILRHDSEEGEKGRASLGTQMRDGDRIFTDVNSRAELLLNPGSYLRLNENSAVRAISTNLTEVRFELLKGSANIEVGELDKKTPIEIVTPNGTVTIAKEGLHRIDAKGSVTLVAVRQGELFIGSRSDLANKSAVKVGRGKVAQLTGTPKPELAKLDKDAADDFDRWCFDRANTLMAANGSALRRSRAISPMTFGWLYDPFYNCYTFIPSRGIFYSPYGFGFFRSYRDYAYYWPYGYGYWGYYPGGGWGNTGGGGNVANPPARIVTGSDRAPVRREIEGRRIADAPTGAPDGGFGGFGGSRSVAMPSAAPAATSTLPAAAPTRSDSGGGGRPAGPSRP
ncbi:MAG: FecR family protein [Acidobacteriota bacterium]